MYTLPHVYVFLPLHINNPIGIGFINSNYLPISSPPMAKPVRRGRERPAQLDPPGHQCPDPEDNSSPTRAHLDGSPAGRGSRVQSTYGVPRWVTGLLIFLGSRACHPERKAVPKWEREKALGTIQGPGVLHAGGHSLPPGPQRPQEEKECLGASSSQGRLPRRQVGVSPHLSSSPSLSLSACVSPSLSLSLLPCLQAPGVASGRGRPAPGEVPKPRATREGPPQSRASCQVGWRSHRHSPQPGGQCARKLRPASSAQPLLVP